MAPASKAVTSLAKGHPEGWNDAFKGNMSAFYMHIANGGKTEPIFATPEQAAYIVRLTEAIMQSSKEKRWIKINENGGIS